MIDDAHKMLSDNAEEQQTLLRILWRTVRTWASRLGQPGGKPVPFKVLLMCEGDEEANQLRRSVATAVGPIASPECPPGTDLA